MTPGIRWTGILPTEIVKNIATLGPLGYWTKMPGTVGSFAGLFWYTLAFHFASPIGYLLLLLASLYIAAAFCGEAEIRLFKQDPPEVILDEFVCIPICFIGLQGAMVMLGYWAWVMLLMGFLIFRVFDIFKPLGIKKMQNLPGGYGVVADDVVAAIATCVLLNLLWFLYRVNSAPFNGG